MRWVNHKIITGCLATLATGDLVFSGICACGAIVPDFVEGKPPDEGSWGYEAWRKSHRQLSHWFVIYTAIAISSQIALYTSGLRLSYPFITGSIAAKAELLGMKVFLLPMPAIIGYCGLAASCGALMHISQDAITGRVPSFNPRKRFGTRLFTVGSIPEYLLAGSILCYCVIRFFS